MNTTRRTVIAALAAGAAGVRAAPAAPGEAVRWPEVPLLDGERWTPTPARAQVVVFWSVTCPFCKRHNAHIDKLYRAAADGGPQVLTGSRDR